VAPDRHYYESWLSALQTMVIQREVLTSHSLDEAQAEWERSGDSVR